VTHLRQLMLDELQRRNYSQSTARCYLHAGSDFAKYFHRSPERLGLDHIHRYQAYLSRERKLSPRTIEGRTAVLRSLFVKTLRRPYFPDDFPSPKRQRRLPIILDQQEVARLIDSCSNLMHRTMLLMMYATGLRRDRDVLLTPIAAGDSARVLALEEAQGLPVPGHGKGCISFRWRDHAPGGKQKVTTVSAHEFLRRFLLHVLRSRPPLRTLC